MRLLVLSVGLLFAGCLGATCAIAQTAQWGQAEDQIPPYETHMDRRHGHDHVYPDRGAIVRDLPQGATTVNYAGIAYQFEGGVWYQRLKGPAYIVVAPPIGVAVPQLPAFATSFDLSGKTYLYANDVFYRPRPDLGGYEVVNDPQDDAPARSRATAGASPSRLASAAPTVPTAMSVPPAPAKPRAAMPPAQPAMPPAQPAMPPAQPATPPAQPATPSAQPATPSAQPATPPAQPTAAPSQPTAALSRPTAAPGQPTAAPSQPTAAPSQPTAAPSQPTAAPVQPKSMAMAPAIPAAAPSSVAPAPANPTGVAIHPRYGQSEDQQAIDRYECYRLAIERAGFDPLSSNAGFPPAEIARHDADYSRAQAACLEARGYTVQ